MIADLKPYPAMKDSGVPWLGEVPEHWEQRALWTLSILRIERNPGDLPLLSVFLNRGVIRYEEGGGQVHAPSLDLTNYQVVHSGDFVLNNQQAWRGSVGVSRHHGIISPAYIVLQLTERLDTTFANYLVRCPAMVDQFVAASKGVGDIQRQIYWPYLRVVRVPFPPLSEQCAIAHFLDHMDRRIRRYIRAKQKLIKLLEEQKQAIIHRAVTRGLDPNARLKPSGVEWLGDVPEHWELRHLKSLVRRIDQGVSPQAENYLADGAAWGVLKAGCVNRGVFKEGEHKRLPAGFAFDPVLAVAAGDVLVSRASGSPNLVGSVGRVPSLKYKLILSDKTFRPVFNQDVDPDFMVLAMNSRYYRQQVEQAISGAEGLANNLPLSSLRAFVFVIPPAEEQRTIIEYLRKATEELRATLVHAEREISLLREYRTRLIADVVTGKLDVREAAARLPEETEAPETLDEIGDDETQEGESGNDLDEAMTSEAGD